MTLSGTKEQTESAPETLDEEDVVAIEEGQRYRLARDVERYPHFVAPEGTEVTVVEVSGEEVRAQAHTELSGADEWDNEIHWYDDPEAGSAASQFRDDTELIDRD